MSDVARYLKSCGVIVATKQEIAKGPTPGFIAVHAKCWETDPDEDRGWGDDDDDDDDYESEENDDYVEYTVVVKINDIEDDDAAEEAAEWFLLKTFEHVEIEDTKVLKREPEDWDVDCDERGYDYAGRIYRR